MSNAASSYLHSLLPEPTAARTSSPLSAAERLDHRRITLEVTLQSPAMLYTKGSLPLTVHILTKKTTPDSSPRMILRSLSVALLTELTATIGPNSTTWSVSHPLVDHSELGIEIRELDHPPGELNSDL